MTDEENVHDSEEDDQEVDLGNESFSDYVPDNLSSIPVLGHLFSHGESHLFIDLLILTAPLLIGLIVITGSNDVTESNPVTVALAFIYILLLPTYVVYEAVTPTDSDS